MIDYDPHDWRSHLLDIHGSMLREILWRVLSCVLWAAVVTIVYESAIGDDPEAKPAIWTMAIHTVLGTALGLLLVFRTNTSYDRFWEGRRMWGNIINESRNLARFCHAYVPDPPLRQRTLAWLVAFVYASMHKLRGERALGPDSERLPAEEARQALACDHVPLGAARQITSYLAAARNAGHISDILLTAGDQNVQLLVDYVGSCERIHKTPLPFAYMVHLRRALLLYCYSLPLALVRDFAWWTIPCTLMVAYILMGIEEIGVEIEDPFGDDENDLPLEEFCALIKGNVEGLGSADYRVQQAE